MDMQPARRPPALRKTSQIPGGFETEDEASPTKTVYDDAVSHYGHSRNTSAQLPPDATDSPVVAHSDGAHTASEAPSSFLDEKEMGRRLMDVESSFLPDQSTSSAAADSLSTAPTAQHAADTDSAQPAPTSEHASTDHEDSTSSSALPFEPPSVNTSALETMSSSPTAAAAQRAVSRVVSLATLSGYETAEENADAGVGSESKDIGQSTPTKSTPMEESAEASPTPKKLEVASMEPTDGFYEDADDEFQERKTPRKRPRYLSSRMASQRSSYSSNTTTSAEGTSDITVGAEYALQSGGGLPLDTSPSSRPDKQLLRTISLGSVASGVSRASEAEGTARPLTARKKLTGLAGNSEFRTSTSNGIESGAETPRGPGPRLDTPTDTVINQRIRNLEVPGTVAKKFRQTEESEGADRPNGNANARVKNLTLKEQSSVIDKLQKENWKLKLKLYFMDQMLTERSDEAVKAMVQENVELKTLKFSSTKEIRGLKRTIRELEAKLRERDERLAAQAATARNNIKSPNRKREPSVDMSGELAYLRERVNTSQQEIERLQSDNATKEGEKRRLAEMLKSTGERSNLGSDVEGREEIALWKDLLETETSRKDQAEDENRKLKEEVWRLKAEASSSVSTRHQVNGHSKPSEAASDGDPDRPASSTLVEQLRSENEELKRDLGAQTSMLTSRNREKERLYQEIEDLKMGQRRGPDGRPRSMAGTDSLLERSASRAHGRPGSRGSGGSSLNAHRPRGAKLGEAERESYESANDELRDQLAALRLENQELATQLDRVLDELEQAAPRAELEQLRARHDELAEQAEQDLLALQAERDEALQLQEEAELGFQDLRAEAQDKIDALEAELDAGADALAERERALGARDAEAAALRNEVRMTSEGLGKVEADVQAQVRRVKDLELENEEIQRELEEVERGGVAATAKAEKLAIELESRQSECAFLREEQDGCMIKIGNLEAALRAAQAGLGAEREKARDLEARLADERHQREVIGSQEKQEVQKMMNDLNREAAGAQDESRRLKKSLETREAEVTAWKEQLTELENGLHEVLGETGGSKSSFVHVSDHPAPERPRAHDQRADHHAAQSLREVAPAVQARRAPREPRPRVAQAVRAAREGTFGAAHGSGPARAVGEDAPAQLAHHVPKRFTHQRTRVRPGVGQEETGSARDAAEGATARPQRATAEPVDEAGGAVRVGLAAPEQPGGGPLPDGRRGGQQAAAVPAAPAARGAHRRGDRGRLPRPRARRRARPGQGLPAARAPPGPAPQAPRPPRERGPGQPRRGRRARRARDRPPARREPPADHRARPAAPPGAGPRRPPPRRLHRGPSATARHPARRPPRHPARRAAGLGPRRRARRQGAPGRPAGPPPLDHGRRGPPKAAAAGRSRAAGQQWHRQRRGVDPEPADRAEPAALDPPPARAGAPAQGGARGAPAGPHGGAAAARGEQHAERGAAAGAGAGEGAAEDGAGVSASGNLSGGQNLMLGSSHST